MHAMNFRHLRTFVAIADNALLGAKAAGRNRVALAEFPVSATT